MEERKTKTEEGETKTEERERRWKRKKVEERKRISISEDAFTWKISYVPRRHINPLVFWPLNQKCPFLTCLLNLKRLSGEAIANRVISRFHES